MSDTFSNILVFCVVLLLYLHINKQLKISDDLEVYELIDLTKDKLDDVIEYIQPTVVDFNYSMELNLQPYKGFDLNIRNVNDEKLNTEIYLPLQWLEAKSLLKNDLSQNYFTEMNMDFLRETGLDKHYESLDELLRPSMCCDKYYDLLMGSANVCTPFRFHLNNRFFLFCLEGSINIKLAPPKNTKYLNPVYDYDNFEFSSPMNPWNIQANYSKQFLKVKCMDVELSASKLMYIPPYWWYTIKFSTPESKVAVFSYKTYMNLMSICPHYFIYFLQKQNIKPLLFKQF